MPSTSVILITFLTLACWVRCSLAQFLIDTPSPAPSTCERTLITWSGGTSPFFLSVIPGGGGGSAPALVDLGQIEGRLAFWTVNIADGTSIALQIRDSSGLIATTASFTITQGTTNDCVGSSAVVVVPTLSAHTTGTPLSFPTSESHQGTPPVTALSTPPATAPATPVNGIPPSGSPWPQGGTLGGHQVKNHWEVVFLTLLVGALGL